MDAFALIDWDNLSEAKQQLGLASIGKDLFKIANDLDPSFDNLRIRCYGGWYGYLGLTNKGTALSQTIRNEFPISRTRDGKRITYIQAELVSSPLELPKTMFDKTFRKRQGLPKILQESFTCPQPAQCSVKKLVSWSFNKRCPEAGCTVVADAAFFRHEQKLGDTLLATDLLSLPHSHKNPTILVASDDDDVVPPMLVACHWGAPICYLRESGSVGAYAPQVAASPVLTQSW